MTTSPLDAPISGAISSPTFTGISHQPCPQARTPSSDQSSTYCARRSATVRGMAPSELDTRYVVRSRIGNSGRKERSGSLLIPMPPSRGGRRGLRRRSGPQAREPVDEDSDARDQTADDPFAGSNG